ncbi:hypothetical protein FJR37_26530 [Aphanizomenon sp. UHCC 0183]|nr:hypothetical protein [Aphanizomenon sp. UHCC 0183]
MTTINCSFFTSINKFSNCIPRNSNYTDITFVHLVFSEIFHLQGGRGGGGGGGGGGGRGGGGGENRSFFLLPVKIYLTNY